MEDASDDAAIEGHFSIGRTPLIEDTIIETLKDENSRVETIPALEDLLRWVALFLR